ncbi:hypothetical protein Tco_0703209 [Tanacetum coccineum]|uniref:Uncharacterized protein n=1 Tax=Tanacetum coccineum TaxID=301880 RepID=A0ABQ4Y023_9ASTR
MNLLPLVFRKIQILQLAAGNPVKKILLKLNLSDHRLCKMVVEVPDSSWLTRSITTCSYPTDKHKVIMKAQQDCSHGQFLKEWSDALNEVVKEREPMPQSITEGTWNLKKQDNSDYVCIHRDDSMSSDNLCVSNSLNVVKSRAKPKKNKSKKDSWKPTGKLFTQIGYIWGPTAPEVIVLVMKAAVAPEHAVSTGSPSSTIVDQDAPSPSNSHTTQETQTPIISHDVEEDNHDIEVAHMGNDPYFGIPIPEVPSDQSSSPVVIHTIVPPDHQVLKQ